MSAIGSVVVFNTYLFLTYGAVITVEYVNWVLVYMAKGACIHAKYMQ